jgi:hypothetical protein
LVLAAALVAGIPCVRSEELKASPQTQAPAPASIDRNGVLILIRSTLLALDHANKTGNYTVLRDLGAPGFQTNTDARLGEIFATQRRDNIDLSGVAVLEPQLTVLPQIDANGMMRMAGFFPSVPTQVNFDLIYAPVNRQWRVRHLGCARPGGAGRAARAVASLAGAAGEGQSAAGEGRPAGRVERPGKAVNYLRRSAHPCFPLMRCDR